MRNVALNTEIGNRIRELRTFQKMSREKLAEKADISVQFLSEIEYGKKSMTAPVLANLCTALNTSSDYILFGKKESAAHSKIPAMMATLTEEEMTHLEELVLVFIRALHK